MVIQLNGNKKILTTASLLRLVEDLKLLNTPCAVLINGDIVKKENISNVDLKSGDDVEIISFVGGG